MTKPRITPLVSVAILLTALSGVVAALTFGQSAPEQAEGEERQGRRVVYMMGPAKRDSPLDRYVQENPPKCLGDLKASPAHPEPWNGVANWELACACEHSKGEVIAHHYTYIDRKEVEQVVHLSPLEFKCSDCGTLTEFLDTDLHGYDSEMGLLTGGKSWSAVRRGEGERKPVACPECQATTAKVIAVFSYSHFDHIYDQPELRDRAQDFFDSCGVKAKCASCEHEWFMTAYETG